MKYEEWIKYEEKRKRPLTPPLWISPQIKTTNEAAKKVRLPPPLFKRTWTLIVQLFNSLLV